MPRSRVVLRVEHVVPDYETWKSRAFDGDPLGRERAGVRRHRVMREAGRQSLVAVDLEFDDLAAAETFAAALAAMWARVRGRFGWRELPEARLFELAETCEYRATGPAARASPGHGASEGAP